MKVSLDPGQCLEIPVVISWDLPVTAFATGVNDWRRYTDFHGRQGTAAAIAAEALRIGAAGVTRSIMAKTCSGSAELPEPLRMALFKLYPRRRWQSLDGCSTW